IASLLITVGFMVQDVVADALSVEVAETDEEIGQIQTFGRMATLAGGISVGYLSGWLAEVIGTRATFGVAALLPLLVALSVPLARPGQARARLGSTAPSGDGGPLGGGKARMVMLGGLGYASFRVGLEGPGGPFYQEVRPAAP